MYRHRFRIFVSTPSCPFLSSINTFLVRVVASYWIPFPLSLVVYTSLVVIVNVQTMTSPDSSFLVTQQTCVLRNTVKGPGYLMMKFSLLFSGHWTPLFGACRLLKSDDDSTKSIIVRYLYPAGAIVASFFLRSLVLVDEIQKSNIQWILVCLAAKNADTLAQSTSNILLTVLTGTAAVMCF